MNNLDIPFINQRNRKKLELDQKLDLVISGADETSDVVGCSCGRGTDSVAVPKPMMPFLFLLDALNSEISHLKLESEPDRLYWISLRTYLNGVMQNTLENFHSCKIPHPLICWLFREFSRFKHDRKSRRSYEKTMKNHNLEPYDLDIFALGENSHPELFEYLHLT